jgi:outer membrane protein
MLKKISLIACLLFVASVTTDIQAQQTKIGYVDPQAILNKMPEMEAIKKRVENFEERQNAQLAIKKSNLDQAFAEYNQKKDVISPAAKQTEEEKLLKMEQEFNQSARDARIAIQNKSIELSRPVQEQIGKAIDAVAKRLELSYVLNLVTSTGDFIILYASDEYARKYNITGPVMIELGIGS